MNREIRIAIHRNVQTTKLTLLSIKSNPILLFRRYINLYTPRFPWCKRVMLPSISSTGIIKLSFRDARLPKFLWAITSASLVRTIRTRFYLQLKMLQPHCVYTQHVQCMTATNYTRKVGSLNFRQLVDQHTRPDISGLQSVLGYVYANMWTKVWLMSIHPRTAPHRYHKPQGYHARQPSHRRAWWLRPRTVSLKLFCN